MKIVVEVDGEWMVLVAKNRWDPQEIICAVDLGDLVHEVVFDHCLTLYQQLQFLKRVVVVPEANLKHEDQNGQSAHLLGEPLGLQPLLRGRLEVCPFPLDKRLLVIRGKYQSGLKHFSQRVYEFLLPVEESQDVVVLGWLPEDLVGVEDLREEQLGDSGPLLPGHVADLHSRSEEAIVLQHLVVVRVQSERPHLLPVRIYLDFIRDPTFLCKLLFLLYFLEVHHFDQYEQQYLHLFLVFNDQVQAPVRQLNGEHVPAEHVAGQVRLGWLSSQLTILLIRVDEVLEHPEATVLATKDKASEIGNRNLRLGKVGESLVGRLADAESKPIG